MKLTKEERNDILLAIQNSGLQPIDFDPPQETEFGTVVRHEPSGSMFVIGDQQRDGSIKILKQVGSDPMLTNEVPRWSTPLSRWLEDIERYIETPDLWAEMSREREALDNAVPAPADNTPFTKQEQEEIAENLRNIAAYAAGSGRFDDDQLRVIDAKINYLIESAKHSRRFDWREQLVGTFVGAVVSNALPQGATMEVLQMVVGAVGHLIGHPMLGLPR